MSFNFLSFNFVAFKPIFSPKPFVAEVHILKEDGNEENEGILFYIKPCLIISCFITESFWYENITQLCL